MIKACVTKKALREEPYILAGSWDIKAHLTYLGFEADFYTKGIYGWNEDIYHITPTTYITCGYRPTYRRWLTDDEERALLAIKDKEAFANYFRQIAYDKE